MALPGRLRYGRVVTDNEADGATTAAKATRVREDQQGQTLGAILRSMLKDLSWGQVRKLCATGKVMVDGETLTDAAHRMAAGASITIDELRPRPRPGLLPERAIVHLDHDVLVVNKPAGVLSVPYDPADRDTLVDLAQATLRRVEGARAKAKRHHGSVSQSSLGERRRSPGLRAELGVVQRLDKDTSGLLVFTRTLAAKRHVAQQLRDHTVHRRYLAIVLRSPTFDSRTIDSELVGNRGDGLRGSRGSYRGPGAGRGAKGVGEARRAITHVRVLARAQGAALVECRLETGRQHQIRIHLSEAGHPLVGEKVYIRDYRGEVIAAPRTMLHAAELGFVHPQHEEEVRFHVPPPPDFAAVQKMLGLNLVTDELGTGSEPRPTSTPRATAVIARATEVKGKGQLAAPGAASQRRSPGVAPQSKAASVGPAAKRKAGRGRRRDR